MLPGAIKHIYVPEISRKRYHANGEFWDRVSSENGYQTYSREITRPGAYRDVECSQLSQYPGFKLLEGGAFDVVEENGKSPLYRPWAEHDHPMIRAYPERRDWPFNLETAQDVNFYGVPLPKRLRLRLQYASAVFYRIWFKDFGMIAYGRCVGAWEKEDADFLSVTPLAADCKKVFERQKRVEEIEAALKSEERGRWVVHNPCKPMDNETVSDHKTMAQSLDTLIQTQVRKAMQELKD